MLSGVLNKVFANIFFTIENIRQNINNFFKNDKVKKVFFIGFLILLFFLISEYIYSAPTTPPPSASGEEMDTGYVSKLIGTSVDKFFEMIMTQLAVMIANLSAVVLALCVLFFTIDFLLKVLTNLGNLSLASLILPNLPSIITFSIIVFLLLPSGQTVTSTLSGSGISTNINNYQLITMGTPDLKTTSLLTGFMDMGGQFFGNKMTAYGFEKPSDVMSAILTIPFSIFSLSKLNNIGVVSRLAFIILSIFSMFTVMSLIKDMLMAFISYVLVVGLSVILMPFLLFQKTAQIGGSIITNIVNKGLSLAIRLGLIGVVVNIIEQTTNVLDQSRSEGINMGTAFQMGFILMIGMFIAGEGGQVADSVLSGRVANLSAGNFIGGAVGKVMGAGATAIVLARKGTNAIRKRRENRELRNSTVAKNQADTADKNQLRANNETIAQNQEVYEQNQEAYNQATQDMTRTQRSMNDAEQKLERARASGNQKAIRDAENKLARRREEHEEASVRASEASARASEAGNNITNANARNEAIQNRMTARNERHEILKNDITQARKEREESIQATRVKMQKGATAIASALGGASAGAVAGSSVSNVIAMGEAFGSGVAKIGGAGISFVRGTAVVGIQGGKALSTLDPRLSSEERSQRLNEVRNDLGDMAKHFYKDKVNALSDGIRRRTVGIRGSIRSAVEATRDFRRNMVANGGGISGFQATVAQGVAQTTTNIYNSEAVQNFVADAGFGERNEAGHTVGEYSYRNRDVDRDVDQNEVRQGIEFVGRYASMAYQMGLVTVQNGIALNIDEIRNVNNITNGDEIDEAIKGRMYDRDNNSYERWNRVALNEGITDERARMNRILNNINRGNSNR